MFGASGGLFFFWCLSMFCEVRVAKPAQAPKRKKKQTTRCTKPAQAPKKTKKLKLPGTMGPLLSSGWIFCFFGACRCLVHLVVCFFWCLSMFGASSGFFFGFFFGACQCFCISHVKIMMKKVRFTRVLDPPNA